MKKQGRRNEKGQSLIIIAFAIFTLIGFVGLAIDLGLAYVERIRVRRAADAAALAAAAELPLENAAIIRALEFLEENDYGCGLTVATGATSYSCTDANTRVEINLGAADQITLGNPNSRRTIRINTSEYRDTDRPNPMNTASRIRVEVVEDVDVFFMRIFNFSAVPVQGLAVGENINQLDIALVFDNSGSMEFDTICYGCWAKSTLAYPQGTTYPLTWDGDRDGQPDHCEGNTPLTYSGKQYIVIEAEEYSATNNSYNRQLYNIGDTYWAIQRNGNQAGISYMGNAGAYGRDVIGAYIQHRPSRTHVGAGDDGTGVPCTWEDLLNGFMCRRSAKLDDWGGPRPAPRTDYTFKVPTTGTWYFWVRIQGGDTDSDTNRQNRALNWGINNAPIGRVYARCRDSYTDGASSNYWTWHPLTATSGGASIPTFIAGQTYTLNLWAGGPGSAVDRIIITNDSRDPATFFTYASDGACPAEGSVPGGRENGIASGYSGIVNGVLRGGYVDNNRTGAACDPCDARFGGSPSPEDNRRPVCTGMVNPQERYLDDLYDDEQPMRASVEAAKNFVRRLDPRYDQVGYVSYNGTATIRDRLQCLRQKGVDQCIAGYDPDLGKSSTIIENTVIAHLDSTTANDGTNIGHGIMLGIEVLSNRKINGVQNYGRPGAAHIMIVMTDGETNTLNGVDPICYAEQRWPIRTGNLNRDRAKDCAIYYAMQARNNGIVIYSITLGATADIELMEAVAEITGGVHRHAPRPEQLNTIFDELYERIFLRLVQ